jgi:hypothetical protein
MTALDVVFRYGSPPGESEMRALNRMREVYGIRRMVVDEKQQTIRIEYDASRLTEGIVAGLLRRAGVDVREKVELV